MTIKLAVACDHGGYPLKVYLKENFKAIPVEWLDLGTNSFDSVDYPDYGRKLAEVIANKEADYGLAICGSGIGISIACNRNPYVRAALCMDGTMARLSREHNDANIVCMGQRITGTEVALDILKAFLETKFAGGRHTARVEKLNC